MKENKEFKKHLTEECAKERIKTNRGEKSKYVRKEKKEDANVKRRKRKVIPIRNWK